MSVRVNRSQFEKKSREQLFGSNNFWGVDGEKTLSG
jgi:hypothetical protein